MSSINEILKKVEQEKRQFLYEYEAKQVLGFLGLPTPPRIVVKNQENIQEHIKNLNFPVAIKVMSPQILHKSDVGAVALNVPRSELSIRFNTLRNNIENNIPEAEITGYLIEEMSRPGTEIIIGATRDAQFGPVIMFGIGGILTEVIKDVSFKVAPLSRSDAVSMLDEIRSKAILHGVRGKPGLYVDGLVDVLMSVSHLMIDHPEIDSIDLNPLFVYSDRINIVDARIILGESKKTPMIHLDRDLTALFSPRSVAVIGASSNPNKIGHKILKNIIDAGYKGKIYPVNPRGDAILGYNSYTSLSEISGTVDSAVIVVPSKFVPDIMNQCREKQVKSSIIISSGFRDIGKEGIELEKKILKIAHSAGIHIIGPNCQGISKPVNGFCATWPLVKEKGNVSVISQSGTIALEVPSYLKDNGLGYSKSVALGNKSDVDEADLINWFADDDETKVIAVYTEGMPQGRKLMESVKNASGKKPVVILKSGKSESGKKAVLAHTGTLAGSYKVFESAITQSGGICVENLQELCDSVKAFSLLSPPRGKNVAMITSSGGAGILSTDACEKYGLAFAKFEEKTVSNLQGTLPDFCVIHNPLDLTGNAMTSPELYTQSIEVLLDDKNIDMILVIFGDPVLGTVDVLKEQFTAASKRGIPLVVCYLGGAEVQKNEEQQLQSNKIPVYQTPYRAISSLSNLYKWSKVKK